MIVFEKWTLTKNLTDPDAGMTTIAQLFFFEVELKNYKSYGSAAKVTPVLTYTPYNQTVQDLTNTQSHLHAYCVKTTVRTENT